MDVTDSQIQELLASVSRKKISNIAVCMFGSYRTGNYCIPNIADFFKNDKGVNVDYFCAFKDYDSFYTSDPVTDDEYKFKKLDTDDIILNLKKHFNLKDFKISTIEQDTARRGSEWPFSSSYLFSSYCDSIMLKSKYEAENDFIYDLVFLLRYDVLLSRWQRNTFINNLIDVHDGYTYRQRMKDFGSMSDRIIFAHHIEKTYGELNKGFQDMVLCGTSLGVDAMASGCLWLARDQNLTNKKNHVHLYEQIVDGHDGLNIIFSKNNITVSPFLYKNTHGMPHIICPTLVRSRRDLDLTLDPLSDAAFEYHMNGWIPDRPGSTSDEVKATVCLYGEFRTGKTCVPKLHELFGNKHTRYELALKNTERNFNIDNKYAANRVLSFVEIDNIKSYLTDTLGESINDISVIGHEDNTPFGRIFSGILGVLEKALDNDLTAESDFIIVTRYDIEISTDSPRDMLVRIKNSFNYDNFHGIYIDRLENGECQDQIFIGSYQAIRKLFNALLMLSRNSEYVKTAGGHKALSDALAYENIPNIQIQDSALLCNGRFNFKLVRPTNEQNN